MTTLFKELTETIYAENDKDPANPEVLVKGVGRYQYKQLTHNVKQKIHDLAKRIDQAQSADQWKSILYLLTDSALKPMIDAIASAATQLEDREENK